MSGNSLNTYEKILSCAVSLFDEKGYSETSISDIYQAADAARSTFYKYFSGKEELCYHLYSRERVYDAKTILWITQGSIPSERVVRAHLCYLRYPSPKCAAEVHRARLQFLLTTPEASLSMQDQSPHEFILPFVEQAKAAGELLSESCEEAVNMVNIFQYGLDLTNYTVSEQMTNYAVLLEQAMRKIYCFREHIPVLDIICSILTDIRAA